MSGGGTQTTTQSSNSEPWAAAQPALKTGLGDAQALYNAGVGGQTYMGSTVIPYAQQTMQGLDSIENQANQNMNGMGISGQSQDIINNGGYNADQKASMDYFNGAGTNPFDLSGNSAYQAYKNNNLDDVQNRVNGSASAAGRYGSGMHSGALTSQLTDAGTNMDMAQFGRLDSLNSQRFNAGQQALGNMSNAYQLGMQPAQSLMNVGSHYEDLAGRVKNDELRIFDSLQNKPWENLGRLNSVANGTGQWGSSTTTAQQPGQNPLLTGIGALSTISSIF